MPQSKSASKLADTVGEVNTGGSSASFSGTASGPQPTLSESSRNAIKGTRWEAMDNQIDENLGEWLDCIVYFHGNVSSVFV